MYANLSRRRFLGVLGAAGASVALSPLSAIHLADDLYFNSRLGLEIAKPTNWHFVAVRDFSKLLDRQQAELKDSELTQELRNLSGDPILVANKYREEIDGFCPSIQVYANPLKPLTEPLENYCRRGEGSLRKYFRNYELQEPVAVTEISGFPAGEYRFTYLLALDRGRAFETSAKMLIVLTDRAEFCFGFAGAASGPEAEVQALAKVQKSIRLS